jgi:PAS domain S-box-containing protein
VKWKKTGRLRNEELNIITRRGEERIVLLSADSVKDAHGKLLHSISVQRDITERKRMEEKLRQYSEHLEELVQKRTEDLLESETRYSVLVEEASDGVVILQDEKIVFINKRLLEISGYSRDELIGIPFEKIGKMVDEKYRQLVEERHERRIRGEEVPARSELELIAKTGERIPIEASSALIHHNGHPAVLTIVRDIRERKRMEEQRLRLEKLAAVGEVATMVGHDLRNPLQSIEIATYALNNELSRLSSSFSIPQETMVMLKVIDDSVNYADKIIRDLHDFSIIIKPTLKKASINTILKETLSQVKTQQNVELITQLGHLPEIRVDKDMIKRVFLNLVLNGIQTMKEKGGRLKVSTTKTKGFVEVSFKDTGVGIPKENMEKIFTPFFTTKAKGMGMGLAICKKFVESHGGSVEVESEEGKGSTFTVKLPILQKNGGGNS